MASFKSTIHQLQKYKKVERIESQRETIARGSGKIRATTIPRIIETKSPLSHFFPKSLLTCSPSFLSSSSSSTSISNPSILSRAYSTFFSQSPPSFQSQNTTTQNTTTPNNPQPAQETQHIQNTAQSTQQTQHRTLEPSAQNTENAQKPSTSAHHHHHQHHPSAAHNFHPFQNQSPAFSVPGSSPTPATEEFGEYEPAPVLGGGPTAVPVLVHVSEWKPAIHHGSKELILFLKRDREMTKTELRKLLDVQRRDLRSLALPLGSGRFSSLLVRKNAIIIHLDNLQAVIQKNRVWFFNIHHPMMKGVSARFSSFVQK